MSDGIGIGSVVAGRYRILDQLGSGATSLVFRAEDGRTGRLLALKVLPPLAHPGVPFLAMELVHGTQLRLLLARRGRLRPPRAVQIALHLCEALEAVHAAGIVHRDLKPENVMILDYDRRGELPVKLVDFGVAKLVGAESHQGEVLTTAGDLIGTPQYMAPEQIKGQALDGRADLHALGALLFEMVTGRHPFEGPWR